MGVATGTAALIIVLSVFNGFDGLLKSLYNSFDADIKILASKGKTFVPDKDFIKTIETIDFIEAYSYCIEENAMLEFGNKQKIATIKGVDNNYNKVTGIDTMIIDGTYKLYQENTPLSISGQIIAYRLGLNVEMIEPISIYVPSRSANFRGNFQDASDNINKALVYNVGVFTIQQEYDSKYFILPIDIVRKLLEYDNQVGTLEIKLKSNITPEYAVDYLKKTLGDDFDVQDRNKQHEYAYKIMQSEKWAIFMILVFILLIASFNVIGSLTMLIIDKKMDIQVLRSLGAEDKTIRRIFFLEGVFISILGAISGLIIGGIICWLQIEFGLVKLGNGGSFIIDSYPVIMKIKDFFYVLITVLIIGIIAAWYPVRYITRKYVA